MAYRNARILPDEQQEHAAVRALAAKAKRVRTALLLPGILLGLVCVVGGYLALRGLQLERMHAHVPWLTAAMSAVFFPPPIRLGQWLGRAVVRSRAPRWVEALSKVHGVPAETLSEYTALL